MSDRRAKAVTAAGTSRRSIACQSVINVLGAASHDIDLGAASHDIDLGAASHDIDTARTNCDQRPSTLTHRSHLECHPWRSLPLAQAEGQGDPRLAVRCSQNRRSPAFVQDATLSTGGHR
jgi:hypothetical protein